LRIAGEIAWKRGGREQLVQLGIEDTVGDELSALRNSSLNSGHFDVPGGGYAELNEFFQRELAEEGYSGVEVRVTPTVTDISTS
jgi:hypothetical protein